MSAINSANKPKIALKFLYIQAQTCGERMWNFTVNHSDFEFAAICCNSLSFPFKSLYRACCVRAACGLRNCSSSAFPLQSFHFHNFRLPNSKFRRVHFTLTTRTACSVSTCCGAEFLFVIRCESSPLTHVAIIARFLHIICAPFSFPMPNVMPFNMIVLCVCA